MCLNDKYRGGKKRRNLLGRNSSSIDELKTTLTAFREAISACSRKTLKASVRMMSTVIWVRQRPHMIRDAESNVLRAANFGSCFFDGLNTRFSKFDSRPKETRLKGNSLAGSNNFVASVLAAFASRKPTCGPNLLEPETAIEIFW